MGSVQELLGRIKYSRNGKRALAYLIDVHEMNKLVLIFFDLSLWNERVTSARMQYEQDPVALCKC
jgi:hypothetical protein